VLLFWKSVLLIFGETPELNQVKKATNESLGLAPDENKKDLITASPLDYHLFRQEITSKYPAYNPPPPLFPVELENKSILPPLPNHPSRISGSTSVFSGIGPANVNSSNGSILHQPVHITTPAPSPPPSPAGPGGKGGKKQNYQTNQNFPFMYPPLDSTSLSAGGKGAAGLQEILVGRKWEGSDIPASILEAGELFAQRMRMTRAMRQLWDERERFMKFERGWGGIYDDSDVDNFELGVDSTLDENAKTGQSRGLDYATSDPAANNRLEAVEDFFVSALPAIQSSHADVAA
jgi:hypothetical protein